MHSMRVKSVKAIEAIESIEKFGLIVPRLMR